MALLLRIVTRPKWIAPDSWKPGDVPADALTDLRTHNNGLSVWNVDTDRSNLDSVIVAVASNRERLDKLDYALFDEAVLSPLGIRCIKSDGDSPHQSANVTMHRDLTELTAQKLASLAAAMMPLQRVRVPQNQVKRMILSAVQSNVLDEARMPKTLLTQLAPP
jgi:hypothetical protein